MNARRAVWILSLLAILWDAAPAFPDDEAEEREHEEHRDRDDEHRSVRRDGRRPDPATANPAVPTPARDPIYTGTCSACHFAYPPELLPARSWSLLLSKLPDHFGETVELDAKELTAIASYLTSHAADRSQAKRAASILRSVGKQTPMRITETPYIRNKHDEVKASVLKRKSIGSLSNCTACHRHATQGVFEEEDVRIPPP